MVIYRIAKLPLLPNVHASEGNQSAVPLKDPVRPLVDHHLAQYSKNGKNSAKTNVVTI